MAYFYQNKSKSLIGKKKVKICGVPTLWKHFPEHPKDHILCANNLKCTFALLIDFSKYLFFNDHNISLPSYKLTAAHLWYQYKKIIEYNDSLIFNRWIVVFNAWNVSEICKLLMLISDYILFKFKVSSSSFIFYFLSIFL